MVIHKCLIAPTPMKYLKSRNQGRLISEIFTMRSHPKINEQSQVTKSLAFSLQFQKKISITVPIFLHVGQNNFGNKLPCFERNCNLKTPTLTCENFEPEIVKAIWLNNIQSSENITELLRKNLYDGCIVNQFFMGFKLDIPTMYRTSFTHH